MGGHGHGPPYTIPDYKQFKVEGIAELETLQQALSKKGLKDSWIRNEAWRYNPGFGTKGKRALKFFFRGLPIGIGLTVLTVGFEKLFSKGGDHGHHH